MSIETMAGIAFFLIIFLPLLKCVLLILASVNVISAISNLAKRGDD